MPGTSIRNSQHILQKKYTGPLNLTYYILCLFEISDYESRSTSLFTFRQNYCLISSVVINGLNGVYI